MRQQNVGEANEDVKNVTLMMSRGEECGGMYLPRDIGSVIGQKWLGV